METSKIFKKKRDIKIQNIYSRCLLTRKIILSINLIGKNLDEVIEQYIQDNFEGKCAVEGFIKQNSCKIIRYSCGTIQRGNNVVFEVVFECDVCFLVEGMLIQCLAKKINKAGIECESASDFPSPIVVFLIKDHHYNSQSFTEIKENDKITVRVIGQRFELNDKYISVIAEYVKEKEYIAKQKPISKPRLVIEE